MDELIKFETVNAVDIFKDRSKTDVMLKKVRDAVKNEVPDVTTAKGRTRVIKNAADVGRLRTGFDKERIKLVADEKARLKLIDVEGKYIQDNLAVTRDLARQPVTDWENAEKERIEAERVETERIAQEERERVEAEQKAREDALAKKEAELEAKEKAIEDARIAEELRVENARIAEENRLAEIARQEKIKTDAAESARLVAAEEIEAAKQREFEQKIIASQAVEAKAQAIKQAGIDQAAAVQKATDDAERRAGVIEAERQEKERIQKQTEAAQEAEAKRTAEAKAANLNHRKSFNNKAVDSLVDALGCDRELGINIVKAVAMGKIENVTINY
jgi:colicin import membrane protein